MTTAAAVAAAAAAAAAELSHSHRSARRRSFVFFFFFVHLSRRDRFRFFVFSHFPFESNQVFARRRDSSHTAQDLLRARSTKLPKMCGKSVRTSAMYLLAIQLLFHSISIGHGNCAENAPSSGAEFLKNVMGNLRRPQTTPLIRKTPRDRIDVQEYIPDDIPYASQSNEIQMLSKLPFNYNGQNVNDNKNQGDSLFAQFLNAESTESQGKILSQQGPQQFNPMPMPPPPPPPNNPQAQNLADVLSGNPMKPPDGTINGYNYFFYPLDSKTLQQLQNGNNQQTGQNPSTEMQDSNKSENQVTKPKVQPLFVAMAGFVGVAVVFLSAMMFIPRLPITLLNSKAALKRAPEELASLTKLVTESIDGKDCSERIACEVGRAMRSMQVGSKPIRMMEIMLPPSVAKQLAQIRRAASKKEQCHFITCKKTEGTVKLVAKLKRPHNKTIHDVREIFNMH